MHIRPYRWRAACSNTEEGRSLIARGPRRGCVDVAYVFGPEERHQLGDVPYAWILEEHGYAAWVRAVAGREG